MRIYFIGIAGSAMGNLACLLREAGHEIAGSDHAAYPPMAGVLAAAGIGVDEGFPPEALAAFAPDAVVVGNALSRGNPQVEAVLAAMPERILSMPAAVDRYLLPGRKRLVITGTHGKTTTASFAAWILRTVGSRCGFLIGGVPRDFAGGADFGDPGAPVVLEGDEYDSAFFDKRSKFIHYRPDVLVINNLEFDHADIFRDLVDVERTFRHLLATVAPGGTVFFNGDDASCRKLLPVGWARCESVGVGAGSDWILREGGVRHCSGFPDVELPPVLPGEHNRRNAAMAWLAARRVLGDPPSLTGEALLGFSGVKRRLELLAQEEGWLVIEDFGHHPTAIAANLRTIREQWGPCELTAALEPRSNTLRTRALAAPLVAALSLADRVWFAPVHRSAGLADAERFDSVAAVRDLEAAGVSARAFADFGSLAEAAEGLRSSRGSVRRVLVLFSNGAFGGLPALLARTDR